MEQSRSPAKVLSVGIGNGHTLLFQLRQKIDDALLAAGWPGELSSFSPHVTVPRVQNATEAAVDHWLRRHQGFTGPLFRVENFQLMQS